MKAAVAPLVSVSIVVILVAAILVLPVPTTLDDVFLPGSQPGQSGQLEHPQKCDNCHGSYDLAVEPAFNWRGSMMSQAARDPLYFACLAIANQDAPDSGDLCIRCHSPAGWLEGRSTPTDGSALNNNDREGVQCDFCHKLIKPTPLGVNPYPLDPDYTADGYDADQAYLATLSHIPSHSANGMYIADAANLKRGPFIDAAARHKMLYSPFHQDAALCGTCHDVSNPVYSRQPDGTYMPNDFGQPFAADAVGFDSREMFPVERTYSEWLNSDFNLLGGVAIPDIGGNKLVVSTCQDCHMRDVSGVAANKKGSVYRDDLPLHDLTGGNTFIPGLIEGLFPGETDPAALEAGVQRARSLLQMAATLVLTVDPAADHVLATVRVTNQTGHKLPSGYPEGRRIWLNVRGYDAAGAVAYESGAYDEASGVLTHDADAKIYEIKPGISANLAPIVGLDAGPSFHFVLNNHIYSDNRIPPRGFTNAAFEAIQSPPVDYTYADGQFWDDTSYLMPSTVEGVEVTLYYQTVSKEYVEFLRDENRTNDWGQVFYDLWAANGKSAPEVMATASWGDGGGEPPPPPPPPPATTVHVASIVVGHGTRGKSQYGTATVTIADEAGNPVPNATVTGTFNSGSSATGATGDAGQADLRSDNTKRPPSSWCFDVTGVSGTDMTYDPAQNDVTSACEGAGKRGGDAEQPAGYVLEQNHPNPFNPSTVIRFTLPEATNVQLTVHDVAGQLVETLFEGSLGAGNHSYIWHAGNRASGAYLYRLRTADQVLVRQMMLVK